MVGCVCVAARYFEGSRPAERDAQPEILPAEGLAAIVPISTSLMAAFVARLALHLALVLWLVVGIEIVVIPTACEFVLLSGAAVGRRIGPPVAVPACLRTLVRREVLAALVLVMVAVLVFDMLFLCVVPSVGIAFVLGHLFIPLISVVDRALSDVRVCPAAP